MQRPVDYRTVEAIQPKHTVMILNSFVINTTEFLNKFSYWCEKKLSEVSKNIERLEITMNILEAKLASIPGLEGAYIPTSNAATTSIEAPAAGESLFSGAPPPPPPPGGSSIPPPPPQSRALISEEDIPPETPQVEDTSGVMKVKDDPKFEKWFKMLRLGVAVPQIKMQMKFNGLDPDLLDDPDAPSPSGGGVASKPAKKSAAIKESDDEEEEEQEPEVPQFQPPPPPPPSNISPRQVSFAADTPSPKMSSMPPMPAALQEEEEEEEEEVAPPPMPPMLLEPIILPPPLPIVSNQPILPPPLPNSSNQSHGESEDEDEEDDD